jgi:hypothetical protein
MKFNLYEVPTDLIDFLRGEGNYKTRQINKIDQQVKAHEGQNYRHSNKYLGIIIEFSSHNFFAPLTHDGNKKWLNRNDTCDFERIYINNAINDGQKYVGSVLLCKALPLSDNLILFKSLKEIERSEGLQYMIMCRKELEYLNNPLTQNNIKKKMRDCICDKESPYKSFRVDYNLVIKNVNEYNEMLLKQKNYESNNS